MKSHMFVFLLLLILVVVLTACSTPKLNEESDHLLTGQSNETSGSSLDVVTELVCLDDLGHVVYSAGGYGCEDGEVAVGRIEEFDSPAICCRANI